jgi:hypothetical protein
VTTEDFLTLAGHRDLLTRWLFEPALPR